MYNGTERRHLDSGRRKEDRDFCAVHHILQDEKKESRSVVCGKINALKADHEADAKRMDGEIEQVRNKIDAIYEKIDTFKDLIVGKYWFRIVVGGLCAAIIYIGFQQNWAFKEILENQKEFSIQLHTVEMTQSVMVEKVKKLEERKGDTYYGN